MLSRTRLAATVYLALLVSLPLACDETTMGQTGTDAGPDAIVSPSDGGASYADGAAYADAGEDGPALHDAALMDGSHDGSTACVGAVVAPSVEDTGATIAQGAPEVRTCTESPLTSSASKYSSSRVLVKFALQPAAAAKLATGQVQNARVRITLTSASATAGMTPCLVGPAGNQVNNCLFAYRACPMTSAWSEAPLAKCPSYSQQDPSANLDWPGAAFDETHCGSTPVHDFAVAANHTDEVIDIPISATDLSQAVSSGFVSVYLPPLAPNSSFGFASHEAPDPTKRPQLLFDCNP